MPNGLFFVDKNFYDNTKTPLFQPRDGFIIVYMEVYAEYVIIDNVIIDYMLVFLARKSLKLKVNALLCLLAAAIGAVSACIMPLLRINAGFLLIIKFFTGILMIAVSGKFRRIKEFVFCFYLFLFYTFAFGGGVIAVFGLLGIEIDAWSYASPVPLGIIVGSAFALFLGAYRLTVKLYERKQTLDFVYKCEFTVGGKTFSASGFIDSGNRLTYGKKRSPIVLCSPSMRAKLIKSGALDFVFWDSVRFSTAGGKSCMKVYPLERFLIYNGAFANIIGNVMIGLPVGDVGDDDYDLILSPALAV